MRLGNLRVVPAVKLISEELRAESASRRVVFDVSGLVCGL